MVSLTLVTLNGMDMLVSIIFPVNYGDAVRIVLLLAFHTPLTGAAGTKP